MQPGVPEMVPDWRMGIEVATGAEDAEIRYHPAARADQGDRLLRRVLTLLIQPFHRRERAPLAEQRLDRLRGQVAVAGAHIDHERVGRERPAGRCTPQPFVKSAANHVLNLSPVGQSWRRKHGRIR
jgi:hypothetical protein